jgi:hypothetical protein
MIKKSTFLLLLCAVALGALVYYFDWRSSAKEKPVEDSSKPAFSIQAADITAITLTHPGSPGESTIALAKHGDSWQIIQPLDTGADSLTINGITNTLASARISQTEPGSPDRLKVFGLDPSKETIDFQLKSGSKHSVLLGNTDFTGSSVYAIVDGAKDVALLPSSLLSSTNRPVSDLRDKTVLHLSAPDVKSFTLKNSAGELALTKVKSQWQFSKPTAMSGDDSDISSLLSAVASAKMASIDSEDSANLAKYGLSSPAIRLVLTNDNGVTSTLELGKKDGVNYFARDLSRPMIFSVREDLFKKLSAGAKDLRNKKVVQIDPATVTRVEIQNSNGTVLCDRKKDNPEEWTIASPDAQKGKTAASWKFFTPIVEARATEVEDRAPANIAQALAKPEVQAVLTAGGDQKLTVSFSKELDGFVYARTSAGPETYKLDKGILDNLNFKPGDIAF